jgi:hypothetical protein
MPNERAFGFRVHIAVRNPLRSLRQARSIAFSGWTLAESSFIRVICGSWLIEC